MPEEKRIVYLVGGLNTITVEQLRLTKEYMEETKDPFSCLALMISQAHSAKGVCYEDHTLCPPGIACDSCIFDMRCYKEGTLELKLDEIDVNPYEELIEGVD